MTTVTQTITVKQPHHKQEQILLSNVRFRVVACGRRFGKTEAAKIACLLRLVNKGQYIWYLSPTYENSKRVWREFSAIISKIPGAYINNSDFRAELPNGGVIEFKSTHKVDNLRGAGLDFAVLDEAAFMSPDVWSAVIRPMLLTSEGDALFLSSPYGQNWFWQLYGLGLDPNEPDWQSFHYTSYDNPLIKREELESTKRQTPERTWQEEYLAEFLSDSGRVFRNVRECALAPLDAIYNPNHKYIMGVDWARENDYTVLIVIDATTSEIVAIDRFNQIGWSLQRSRLQAMQEHWQCETIWAELNSIGNPNVEALQQMGLPVRGFQTTSKSKPPLIEGLALAFERNDIAILPDETLIHELISYELERMANGYRYNAPQGAHDDCVMALALAWHGVMNGQLLKPTVSRYA